MQRSLTSLLLVLGFLALLTNTQMAQAQCPTLSYPPGVSNEIRICSGQEVTLSVLVEGVPSSSVIWTTQDTGLSTTIDAGTLINPGTCDNPGSIFAYTAFIPAGTIPGCPQVVLPYTVFVIPTNAGMYGPFNPAPTVEVSDDGCTIEVHACTSLTAEYSVNGGPRIPGRSYGLNPPFGVNEQATVEFFLSNPCGNVEHPTLIGQLDCTGNQVTCPELTPINPNITICSGESATLEVALTGDATPASIVWSTGATGTLNSITGVLTNTTSCDPIVRTYTARIPANSIADCPLEEVEFTVTVLPDPNNGASVSQNSDGCTVSLIGACPNTIVQYSFNGGATQTGSTYIANPPTGGSETGNVVFTISSPTCGTAIFTGGINCDGEPCPSITPINPNPAICSGESVTLQVATQGIVGASSIQWSTGATGTSINTGILTNTTGCQPITRTYTATIPAGTVGVCPATTTTFIVTISPDPTNGVIVNQASDGCSVSVSNTCPGASVQYTVNGGPVQGGSTYVSDPPTGTTEVAIVNFLVTTNCGTGTLSGNINCQGPECPVLTLGPGSQPETTICSGESVNLSVILTGDATPNDVIWDTGVRGLNINTGTLFNTENCVARKVVYEATIPLGIVQNCPETKAIFVVNVLPEPTVGSFVAESPDGCSVSLIGTCPEFLVSYSFNGGPSVQSNSFLADPNPGETIAGNVVYTVTSVCGSANFTGNIFCEGPDCPNLTPIGGLNRTVCSGESLNLSVILTGDATAGDISWSNGQSGTSVNTGILTNTSSCQAITSTYTATVNSSLSDCPPVTVTYIISILPDPSVGATVVNSNEGCITSLAGNCPGTIVQYSVNGGALVTGNTYVSDPAPGQTEVAAVEFFVGSTTCGTAQFTGNINCRGPECPSLSLPSGASSELTICSGESVNLQVLVDGDASPSDVIWSTGTTGTFLNTGALTNVSDCLGEQFVFSARIPVNTVAGCAEVIQRFTITVLPDPEGIVSQIVEQADGCRVELLTCEQFDVRYSVNGGPFISGNVYEADPGIGQTENALVNFQVNTECGTAFFSGDINCEGEQCPSLLPVGSTNLTICSGESASLQVLLNGNVPDNSIEWNGGTTGLFFNTGILNNISSCDGAVFTYTASVGASVPAACPSTDVVFTVTVLPDPAGLVSQVIESSNNCMVSLQTCPNFSVSYSFNGGPQQAGNSFTANPEPGETIAGTVSFTVSNQCTSVELRGDIACEGEPCPELTASTGTTFNICSGETINLGVALSGAATPADIDWSNGMTGTSIIAGPFTNVGDCDAREEIVFATIPPVVTGGNCNLASVVEFTILVAPEPSTANSQVSIGDDGCTVTLSTCDDYLVQYSVNGGPLQSGNSYNSSPNQGQTLTEEVDFVVTAPCGSTTIATSTNCMGESCPQISATNTTIDICAGESANLNVLLSGAATGNDIVWNNNATGTTISTGPLENTGCDPLTFPFTATLNAGGNCPSIPIQFTVVVAPSPGTVNSELLIKDNGCTVELVSCDDFTIQYSVNDGPLQSGNSYTSVAGQGQVVSESVDFLVTGPCDSAVITGSTICQGEACPQLGAGNTVLNICSGESIDLFVDVSGVPGSSVNWSNNASGSSINTGVLTNTSSCEPLPFQFTASLNSSGNCPSSPVQFTVFVEPDPRTNAQIVESSDGCSVSVNTCPGFEVQYVVSTMGTTQTGNTYVAQPDTGEVDMSTVTFFIMNECGVFNQLVGSVNCEGPEAPVRPLLAEGNVVCPTSGGSQYTVFVSIEGGELPYTITGTDNGTVNEEPGIFIFTVPLNEGYFVVVTDASGQSVTIDRSEQRFCGELDVSLLTFDGEAISEGNLLKWATASEVDNDFFTLYHSVDGENFEPITSMSGAGTSATPNSYTFLHKDAPAGLSYYYLTQTDFDGSVTQPSDVITVKRAETRFEIVHVSPIPVVDYVKATFTADATTVTVNVYDLLGRRLHHEAVETVHGQNVVELDMQHFSTGVYILTIDNGAETISTKVLR